METLASPPTQDSVIETDEQSETRSDPFYLAVVWGRWFLEALIPRVQAAPQLLTTKTLTNQNAAIVATALPLPALSAGRYQVSYYVRVTTIAGVASAVQVTIGWTEGGVALTETGALLNLDLTTEHEQVVKFLQIDRLTSITYATNYVSNPVATMKYELIIDVMALP